MSDINNKELDRLDGKLQDILFHFDPINCSRGALAEIAAIKQAFAENTEVSLTMAGIRNFRDGDGNEFLTGSEFYERFVFEYKHKVSYGLEYAHTKDALEAAKRAAGLDT